MAAGIAEQAGQQNGQVLHLTQRPAQLFILNAQGGVALELPRSYTIHSGVPVGKWLELQRQVQAGQIGRADV